MTTTPRIFRNCALALPLVVLCAAVVGGPRVAAEVTVAGSLAVMNFGLLAWFASGFVAETANGNAGGIFGALVVGKMMIALPLFGLLMLSIAPLHAVIGLCVVVAGVALTGVELAVHGSAPARPTTAPDPLES